MAIKNFLKSELFSYSAIAFLLHSIFLLILSLITVAIQSQKDPISIISYFEQDFEIEESLENLDIEIFSEDLTLLNNNVDSVQSIMESPEEQISIQNFELDESPQRTMPELIPNDLKNLDTNFGISSNIVSQEKEISGVLDRLTLEIINHAEKRDLNVIWLFDASISLSNQRNNIKERIEKIFKEISYARTKKINHVVCCFGENLKIITKDPTDDFSKIKNDIDSIPLDETGIENVFGSIERLCIEYKKYRNIIITFTDEIGDDIVNLEECVTTARRSATTIYVVGPPAPFGSFKIQFKYVDPDPKYDQKERWVEINQGPETFLKMTLDLKSLPIDELGLDSGFGPYALTRLCQNTGGIYFSIHPNRTNQIVLKRNIQPLSSNINVFFDIEIMKKYTPDYRNYIAQTNDVQSNKIKMALIKACEIPLHIVYDQILNFTAFSEAEFVEQLSDAQKWSARIEPKIEKIYTILYSVESFSKNLNEKRWQASYNLAMGRILATKCRVEIYNQMLAEAKSGLKKTNPKSNTWKLEHDKDFDTNNSRIKKNLDSAKKYLQFVIENFPDTPWSAIAKEELNTPMGYKWKEGHIEPSKNDNNTNNNNNNNNIPKDDLKRKIEYKPQRKIDKI